MTILSDPSREARKQEVFLLRELKSVRSKGRPRMECGHLYRDYLQSAGYAILESGEWKLTSLGEAEFENLKNKYLKKAA